MTAHDEKLKNETIVRMFISATGALARRPQPLTEDDIASLKWVFGDDEADALIERASGALH